MYKGIRKQKNSKGYYYRIHCKLPNGAEVAVEKGTFSTPDEAKAARKEKLIELTTQDCDDVAITVEEVFAEYIEQVESESVKKKQLTYYNTFIKEELGEVLIGEIIEPLKRLQKKLCRSQIVDGRSGEKQIYISKSYLRGLKNLLDGIFDYAYNCRYISNHPMYHLDEWKAYSKKENGFIEPLFAYLGNKHRILPDLIEFLPNNMETFVDAFAGSAVVGINAKSDKIIINEPNLFLLSIYKALHTTPPAEAWRLVLSVVEKYGLNGENESGYYRCRSDYNQIPYEERMEKFWYWGLCLVYHSFNRSTVQFNLSGEYNAPFGYKKANLALAERKFFDFANKLYNGDFIFSGVDYKDIDLNCDCFVYLDPPYLITTATYNKTWGEEQELEMYDFLEDLTQKGIKWGMSNVLKNNGVNNHILRSWVKKMQAEYKGVKLYYIESTYIHANFRRKNRGGTTEIYITNY